MEHVSHLMEESDHIVVSHQRWPIGRRFREVRHHRSERVASLAIRKIVPREKGPYSRVGVLGCYTAYHSQRHHD